MIVVTARTTTATHAATVAIFQRDEVLESLVCSFFLSRESFFGWSNLGSEP